jgi:hypothetical protein
MRVDMCHAFVEALKWRMRYDDCNPDVGWGASAEYEIDGITVASGRNVTPEEREYILRVYNETVPRRPRY